MIDCGVPYKLIEQELRKVKVLLITHIHGDHIKQATIDSIQKNFPRIKIYGNYEVAYQYGIKNVVNHASTFQANGVTITPFENRHDVLCYGYILQMNGLNIIYATDTNVISNILGLKYDYVFLESNYDEDKLALAINEKHGSYSPYLSNKRHLSTQQCKTFYYVNRRDNNSVLIELHKSRRFY